MLPGFTFPCTCYGARIRVSLPHPTSPSLPSAVSPPLREQLLACPPRCLPFPPPPSYSASVSASPFKLLSLRVARPRRDVANLHLSSCRLVPFNLSRAVRGKLSKGGLRRRRQKTRCKRLIAARHFHGVHMRRMRLLVFDVDRTLWLRTSTH